MIKRSAVMFTVLSAAGVPYLASTRLGSSSDTPPAAVEPSAAAGEGPPISAAMAAPARNYEPRPLEIYQFPETLNFGITPGWVLARWSRVSTSLAELDLQGYRVALVTGTTDGDLAGSLTYYFDSKQHLQRIAFSGSTGDPRPLERVMAMKFQLAREVVDDPSQAVYRARNGKQILGEMRIRAAPVVRSQESRARFLVNFTIDRPAE